MTCSRTTAQAAAHDATATAARLVGRVATSRSKGESLDISVTEYPEQDERERVAKLFAEPGQQWASLDDVAGTLCHPIKLASAAQPFDPIGKSMFLACRNSFLLSSPRNRLCVPKVMFWVFQYLEMC
ncbi:MAG: hypothetical protein CMJ81_11890 [Planctomycetaceae bacterium]|nr:hypothetical protein [Planctomycetaceae bacterium]MBP62693.1 hypothetical protein [Planctomycetaceae bacterium]